jgi:type I restriction enzyme S subunit
LVTLDEVCEINVGRTPPRDESGYWESREHLWVSIGDMSRSRHIANTKEMFSERARRECGMKPVRAGTVLMSFKLSIGKIAFAESELYTNEAIAALPVKNPRQLDTKYLAYALEVLNFDGAGKRAVMGTTLNKASLKLIKIPLPPLPEQRRIAGILDQTDALRRLRRQSLSRLSALGQAIFHEMFGDPISNPKGWDKVELVECVVSSDDIRCGPFGTQLLREEFQEGGVPLWGIKQVNRGFAIPTHEFVTEKKAKLLANYTIIPVDIVMTRKGTIGNCSVYPREFPVGIMHSDLLRLRIDRNKCEPEFISDQLHFSPDIQHQIALISGGAIMQGINVGKLKKIRVLRPPKPLQDEYMRRVHAVQTKREFAIAHEVALDSLFTSLQHRAFRGEL